MVEVVKLNDVLRQVGGLPPAYLGPGYPELLESSNQYYPEYSEEYPVYPTQTKAVFPMNQYYRSREKLNPSVPSSKLEAIAYDKRTRTTRDNKQDMMAMRKLQPSDQVLFYDQNTGQAVYGTVGNYAQPLNPDIFTGDSEESRTARVAWAKREGGNKNYADRTLFGDYRPRIIDLESPWGKKSKIPGLSGNSLVMDYQRLGNLTNLEDLPYADRLKIEHDLASRNQVRGFDSDGVGYASYAPHTIDWEKSPMFPEKAPIPMLKATAYEYPGEMPAWLRKTQVNEQTEQLTMAQKRQLQSMKSRYEPSYQGEPIPIGHLPINPQGSVDFGNPLFQQQEPEKYKQIYRDSELKTLNALQGYLATDDFVGANDLKWNWQTREIPVSPDTAASPEYQGLINSRNLRTIGQTVNDVNAIEAHQHAVRNLDTRGVMLKREGDDIYHTIDEGFADIYSQQPRFIGNVNQPRDQSKVVVKLSTGNPQPLASTPGSWQVHIPTWVDDGGDLAEQNYNLKLKQLNVSDILRVNDHFLAHNKESIPKEYQEYTGGDVVYNDQGVAIGFEKKAYQERYIDGFPVLSTENLIPGARNSMPITDTYSSTPQYNYTNHELLRELRSEPPILYSDIKTRQTSSYPTPETYWTLPAGAIVDVGKLRERPPKRRSIPLQTPVHNVETSLLEQAKLRQQLANEQVDIGVVKLEGNPNTNKYGAMPTIREPIPNVYEQVTDEHGNPVMEIQRDADGNALYRTEFKNGEPVNVPFKRAQVKPFVPSEDLDVRSKQLTDALIKIDGTYYPYTQTAGLDFAIKGEDGKIDPERSYVIPGDPLITEDAQDAINRMGLDNKKLGASLSRNQGVDPAKSPVYSGNEQTILQAQDALKLLDSISPENNIESSKVSIKVTPNTVEHITPITQIFERHGIPVMASAWDKSVNWEGELPIEKQVGLFRDIRRTVGGLGGDSNYLKVRQIPDSEPSTKFAAVVKPTLQEGVEDYVAKRLYDAELAPFSSLSTETINVTGNTLSDKQLKALQDIRSTVGDENVLFRTGLKTVDDGVVNLSVNNPLSAKGLLSLMENRGLQADFDEQSKILKASGRLSVPEQISLRDQLLNSPKLVKPSVIDFNVQRYRTPPAEMVYEVANQLNAGKREWMNRQQLDNYTKDLLEYRKAARSEQPIASELLEQALSTPEVPVEPASIPSAKQQVQPQQPAASELLEQALSTPETPVEPPPRTTYTAPVEPVIAADTPNWFGKNKGKLLIGGGGLLGAIALSGLAYQNYARQQKEQDEYERQTRELQSTVRR